MSAAGTAGSLSQGLAAAARRAGEFLLEPAATVPAGVEMPRVVAVVALAPRCGTTTVARAIASVLGVETIVWEDAAGAGLAERCSSGDSLVLEVRHGQSTGIPVGLAAQVVLVAGAEVEPSLASSVARSLETLGPRPEVVISQSAQEARWEGSFDIALPFAPWAARLARGGGPVLGALNVAIRGLLDPHHRRHAII